MPNGNEQIYARIDKVLADKQISRRKLAQKIGMPPSTLQSAFEKGSNLSFERLTQIADALSVDVNWLLNGFTLEEHDESFYRRLRHEPPLSERELYRLKHPNDEPAEPDLEYSHMVAQEQENERNWYIHQQELLDSINESFSRLNDAGQEEATKRVKELTLLPQYQRPTDAPQDAPAGPDDKESAEK